MSLLFPETKDFRIARLGRADAVGLSDHLRLFEELLVANEVMYPGIRSWFRDKVVPGLKEGSRAAFIGYEDERPIITAVVKRGERTKFCHLRVGGKSPARTFSPQDHCGMLV